MSIKTKSFYEIPYDMFSERSRVIIYGNGRMGQAYMRSLINNRRVKVVAFINSVGDDLQIYEVPVCSLNEINIIKYDFIMLATEYPNVADEMRKNLMSYGVDLGCVYWAGDNKHFLEEEATVNLYSNFLVRNIRGKGKCIVVFMLPEHGNAGDYLIGYAEKKFFNTYFPLYQLIGVTTYEWMHAKNLILDFVKYDDIIVLNGGGYLGDLWEDDKVYKDIIDAFPRHVKIFMPNTLTYKIKPDNANQRFMQDIEWFSKQENLHIMFRENESYSTFRKYYKRCSLFPDMALYMDYRKKTEKQRTNVLLVLRDDREKQFQESDKLKWILNQKNIMFDELDINYSRYVSQENGYALVDCVVEKFRTYKCVITDRLHGMIFAYICGIPCLAFDNSTHKVSGVYEWIRSSGYVRIIMDEEILNIEKIIAEISNCNTLKCNDSTLKKEFEDMSKLISTIIEVG